VPSDLRKHYLDWPHEVSIETQAVCNAACTFCPYPTLDRIGTKMPDDLLDRILDELKDHPWPFILSPFKLSDPLLDKRMIPFCRKAEAELPNAHVRLFTNGSALTPRHIEEIASLRRLMHLWISLNEHRPDEYRALMSLNFDRTTGNLDRLHDAVAAGAFGHEVVVSKVRAGDDTDERFREYVLLRWPLFKPFLIKRDGWLGYVEPESPEIPDRGCGRWFELSITATGVVALCCMDAVPQFPIGDVTKESLFAIYNKPSYRERRVKSLSRREVHPCSTCTYG
jgi:hypothetical protein